MLSLRHIWTMSNFFCNDDIMQQLLSKISFVFIEKVKHIVTLKTIFKYSAADANHLAIKCADLLSAWKHNYMATRQSIEQNDFSSRWEFNKKVLFDDVDHCARISNDIADVSSVFVEFENLFGKRLKSMIFNPDDVDDILKQVIKNQLK